MSIDPAPLSAYLATAFRQWLELLTEEELRNYRFELYDRLEVADPASETAAFAQAALVAVYAQEKACQLHRFLRAVVAAEIPDVDPDAFVDALVALTRAQHDLGDDTDPGGVIEGALEVAAAPRRYRTGGHMNAAGPMNVETEERSSEALALLGKCRALLDAVEAETGAAEATRLPVVGNADHMGIVEVRLQAQLAVLKQHNHVHGVAR